MRTSKRYGVHLQICTKILYVHAIHPPYKLQKYIRTTEVQYMYEVLRPFTPCYVIKARWSDDPIRRESSISS